MKQIIEIEVPDGERAVWRSNTIIFEDAEQLPKTWKDFCNTYRRKGGEAAIDLDSNININNTLRNRNLNIDTDRNLLPNIEAAIAHRALMQLHQLRDCYRQGWIPDWKEDSVKYVIIRNTDVSDKRYRIVAYRHISLFLSFPTRELAEEFLTNFDELLIQADDLI